jgi:hypothetical protein
MYRAGIATPVQVIGCFRLLTHERYERESHGLLGSAMSLASCREHSLFLFRVSSRLYSTSTPAPVDNMRGA